MPIRSHEELNRLIDASNAKAAVATIATPPAPKDWRAREARKFASGKYRTVPWAAEPWAQVEAIREHFCHLAAGDASLIAFTPSAKHGEADRQIQMKPGRYLREHVPSLSAEEVNAWAAKVRGKASELFFARSAQEIEDTYYACKAAHACMSYPRGHFANLGGHPNLHPTHLYCAGDLELAFLKNEEKGVYARVLVWPSRKIFSKAYGDHRAINAALEEIGYRPGLLDGARIRRVELEGARGAENTSYLICPFIDHIKFARDEGPAGALILQSLAKGATHSVQHPDAVAYPLKDAPRRPNCMETPYQEWQMMLAAEEGRAAGPQEAKAKPEVGLGWALQVPTFTAGGWLSGQITSAQTRTYNSLLNNCLPTDGTET